MDMQPLLEASASFLPFAITSEQLSALSRYAELLTEWNQRINLTAVQGEEAIRTRHFLDSLTCFSVMSQPIGRLVDVGTGAGFPGLVLKILRPDIQLTLVESVGKKADFCRLVAEELDLKNILVIPARAEDVGQDERHRERYDWAVARGLAAMPVLAEYLLPLVRVGGHMLAQKGPGGYQEIEAARVAVETLGGTHIATTEIHLPGVPDPHLLIVYEKTQPTPPRYPRRVGVPAKRPL